MYRVDRNNFYENQKRATVFTPDYVSEFLFDLLSPHIDKRDGAIFDPCVGQGSLLRPWKKAGFRVRGVDIEDQGFPRTIVENYLAIDKKKTGGDIALVIMNPPFNIDVKTKTYIAQNYGGRPLLPEVWLQKALALFGTEVPVVMFTPYGFRLNQTAQSKRWQKFVNKEYPEITSIVSLPKNVFEDILFHSEVLIFNMPQLKGHYFLRNLETPLHSHGLQRTVAA